MNAIRLPRGRAADVVLAVAAFAVTLVMSAVAAQPADRPLWPGGVALIALACGALVARRRHPLLTLAVVTAVTPLYYPMGFPDGPVALLFLVALFNAAVECRLYVSLAAVIVIEAGFILIGWLRGRGTIQAAGAVVDGGSVAGVAILLLVMIGTGQYVRGRRAELAAAHRRALEAERDREQEARRRATEERLRIARDLHDVLAHKISLINVQAGAALHRRDDPAQAYASLEAIKRASKETLRELRGVLGVLRRADQDSPPGGDGGPSLARLGELLEHTSACGLAVRRDGEATDADLAARLAPHVALAGYRIVQEALTNALRHAAASTVTVTLRCARDAVIVEIGDDGAGPADPDALRRAMDGGNGLRGMRERAAAVGGEVTAGPGPTGGFRVRARLPATAPAAEQATPEQAAVEQVPGRTARMDPMGDNA